MNFRIAVSLVIVFLIFSSIHLFFFTQNISLKYQLTDLKVKLSELCNQNRALTCAAAKEEDLSRVEKAAREKLGMIYPEKINYILGSNEASPGQKIQGSGQETN